MKNKLLFIPGLILFLFSCSTSPNYKDIYCFLSGTDLPEDELIFYLNEESLSLNLSGYNVKLKGWFDFVENKFKNGQKFILRKDELTKLKEVENLNQCNVTYIAENEKFLLYRYNLTFNSRFLGRVEMRQYSDLNSKKEGAFDVKVYGERLSEKEKVVRTLAENPFPVSVSRELNESIDPGYAVESWMNIKATKIPSEFFWVQNFKSELNTSIFYQKKYIEFFDTLNFKSFSTFVKPIHVLNKKDHFLNYLWNVNKHAFDIENLQTMVLNTYSGSARWIKSIKSSFRWIPEIQDELWQKAEAEKIEDVFFHTIRSGKTGMHYSTSLSNQVIEETDSLNIEFEISGDDLSYATLRIEIADSKNERNLSYNQKIETKNKRQTHSFNFALSNAKSTDRLLIYFENNSTGSFKISKLQGAVVGNFITCN